MVPFSFILYSFWYLQISWTGLPFTKGALQSSLYSFSKFVLSNSDISSGYFALVWWASLIISLKIWLTVKNPVSFIFLNVSLGTVVGLKIYPSIAGLLPKWVIELKTNLEKEYKEGCKAPFVKGSPVQLICKYQNEYNIKENGTILVVASIEDIYFNEELVSDSGFLQLDKGGVVTVNGCDGYALPSLLDRFEYQRPKK